MRKNLLKILAIFFLTEISSGYCQNVQLVNLLNDVRIDSITKSIKQLTGILPINLHGQWDTIKTRHAGTNGNELAFELIKKQFQKFGYATDSTVFSDAGKNIIGTKLGYRFPGKRFIIGAHYDSFTPTVSIAPGADDNASGTSALIEAARIFSSYNFPYTIQFIGWDNEEQGLIGSTIYVSNFTANDSIAAYINMDMLGWDGNNDSIVDIHVRPVASSYQMSNRAMALNSTYSIGLVPHLIDPGGGSTDHAPFWNGGQTAIGFEEEHHSDGNPNWHGIGDSLSKFNLRYYEKVVKLVFITLAYSAMDTLNPVGINENSESTKFTLFPNPVNDMLHLSSSLESYFSWSITTVNGQKILSGLVREKATDIDVSGISPGAYFICTENGIRKQWQKLIICR